jgi:predicted permease
VLGYRYWKTRFNGDPSLIGKRVLLNGRPITIIGIAPKDFLGLTPILEMQAYLPLGMVGIEGTGAADLFKNPKAASAIVVGRLCPGVTTAKAESALRALGTELNTQNPRPNARPGIRVKPLHPPGLISGVNPLPALTALFLTLAGLVLLLASLNVANLLLVRAASRRREIAVRSALGASQSRLLRLLVSESILLAALGAGGGLLLGMVTAAILRSIHLEDEVQLMFDVRMDWHVFCYTAAIALLAGLLMGLAAAARVAGKNAILTLNESTRSSVGDRQRLRTALVMVQVAGSLAVLLAAGLFVRSMIGAEHADLGFDPHHVLNVTLDPHQIGDSEQQGQNFYRALLERVRALPEVRSASLTMAVPLGDSWSEAEIRVSNYVPTRTTTRRLHTT